MRPFASSRAYAAMHYNCESTALNASKTKTARSPTTSPSFWCVPFCHARGGKKNLFVNYLTALKKHAKYAMRQVAAWLSC